MFAGILLQPEATLTDGQFLALREQYPDYRLESTAEGDIIIMPPAHPRTGRRNAAITAQLVVWAEADGRGEAYDSGMGVSRSVAPGGRPIRRGFPRSA